MDARLLFIGEYPREFAGIGVYQPGQRTQIFNYEHPVQKAKADQLLGTGLFAPYDDETAALVKEEVERLKAQAEADALAEKERLETEVAEQEAEEARKAEAEAAEVEAKTPIPAAALEKLRKKQEGVS